MLQLQCCVVEQPALVANFPARLHKLGIIHFQAIALVVTMLAALRKIPGPTDQANQEIAEPGRSQTKAKDPGLFLKILPVAQLAQISTAPAGHNPPQDLKGDRGHRTSQACNPHVMDVNPPGMADIRDLGTNGLTMPGWMEQLHPARPLLPTGHGHSTNPKSTAPLVRVGRAPRPVVGDLGLMSAQPAGPLAWAGNKYAHTVAVVVVLWAHAHFFCGRSAVHSRVDYPLHHSYIEQGFMDCWNRNMSFLQITPDLFIYFPPYSTQILPI